MKPLPSPVLFRFGRSVVPSSVEDLKHWSFRQISETRVAMREGRKEADRLYWFIDGNGCFRSATPVGTELSWLRSIKWLWNFSRVVYELEPRTHITVGEVKKEIAGGSRDPEKSAARDFYRFLKNRSDELFFTREMFLEFMNEPDKSN